MTAAPAAVVAWLAALDPRLWQALIAGIFVAGGWVFNGWQNRRDSARLRREKLRDTHRALFAEIKHNLTNLGDVADLRAYAARMLPRIESDAGFVPFIPKERNDTIFRNVVSDISILPRTTIDPVVQYYSQLAALDALAEDMRGIGFRKVSPERRADMYADYIAMKINLVRYGRTANAVIDAFAHGGRDAADRVVPPQDGPPAPGA